MSTTKESEVTRAARALVKARWAKTKPEERSAVATWLNAQRPAEDRRDPEKPRCPCGAMTAKRAAARRHKCEAPQAPPWETKKRTRKTAQ